MNTRLIIYLIAAALPGLTLAQEEAAELQSYSVGERRPSIEPQKVTIERPKFDTNFTLEAAKPNLSGLKMAKPNLEILAGPAAGSAGKAAEPARTASATTGAGATSGSVLPPGQTRSVRPLSMEAPEYPRDALRRREQGYVVVEFTVNAQGATQDISVVEAEPRGAFESEARRAVARWTFEPALQDGRPVAQRIRHTLEFTLEN
jgi:protein TonB